MDRMKLATVWLGGCSGCHMSFLDLDEWLLELAGMADIVYSPFIDAKEFPEGVDVTLVEGAVANEDNLAMIRQVRERSRVVVSFGDCAVTGNVTSLRNPLGGSMPVLNRCYAESGDLNARLPGGYGAPKLLEKVWPVHQVVPVDVFMPGCPPSAGEIRHVLEALLKGEPVRLDVPERKFG